MRDQVQDTGMQDASVAGYFYYCKLHLMYPASLYPVRGLLIAAAV